MEQDPSAFIPTTFPPEFLTWIKKEHNIPVFFFKASFHFKQWKSVYLRFNNVNFLQVQALLRDKADPNLRDSCSETPLLQAAAQGDLDVPWQAIHCLGGWISPRCWLSVGTSVLLLFTYLLVGGGFKYFLFSPRKLGKMNPFWLIFFRWVGSTTNWLPLSLGIFTC